MSRARHLEGGAEEAPVDPLTNCPAQVRVVQPYRALKTYSCPGCNQPIHPGLGHLVVVPISQEDMRRHWHRPCWHARAARMPGRR